MKHGAAALVAALVLPAGLAACGSDGIAATTTPVTTSDVDAANPTFGTDCSQVATDPNDPGSFQGMVADPVVTAADHNRVLTQMSAAIAAAGLTDRLDGAAALTVFAPSDAAFDHLAPDTLSTLLDDAQRQRTRSPLAHLLEHHVVTGDLDPAAVQGTLTTWDGDSLTVRRDDAGMTVSDGATVATVTCGNIRTTNATVYIIDKVLTGVQP